MRCEHNLDFGSKFRKCSKDVLKNDFTVCSYGARNNREYVEYIYFESHKRFSSQNISFKYSTDVTIGKLHPVLI